MFLFFISVNVYSASLWSETCKKLNPVEFVEGVYIKEKDESFKIYAPEMLMSEEQKELIQRKKESHPEPNVNVLIS